jgi:glycine hydroxymethyltransferase
MTTDKAAQAREGFMDNVKGKAKEMAGAVTGKDAEKGLDRAFLTCNKNGIPYDTRSPFVTSGIRLGTPAGTTRGFGPEEFRTVGKLIAEVVEGLSKNGPEGDAQIEESVRQRVSTLCAAFPV